MRFLVDESADARLANYLKNLGHDATTVAGDHQPGLSDDQVLALATAEGRILITDDRDFGELVFRLHQPHRGVIYFRLSTTILSVRQRRLDEVLNTYTSDLDAFIVIDDRRARARR